MKKLVLFSGGKDSLLCATRCLDNEDEVYLINYTNGYSIGDRNVLNTAKRLRKKYGEKVIILGGKSISPIFRSFIIDIYNMGVDNISKTYGNISISQFNCLACRLAMYVASIIICRKLGISEVIDGARKCQKFAIEQEVFLEEFNLLFNEYQLNISYPLKDLVSDFDLKNELLMRGILPKTSEGQCLLGLPTREVLVEEIQGLCQLYRKHLLVKAKEMVIKYEDILISGELI